MSPKIEIGCLNFKNELRFKNSLSLIERKRSFFNGDFQKKMFAVKLKERQNNLNEAISYFLKVEIWLFAV